jgi:hypothetical protein
VSFWVGEWSRTLIVLTVAAIALAAAVGTAYAALLGILFFIEQLQKAIGAEGLVMILANIPAVPILRSTDTVVRDTDGEEVVRLSATEFTVRYPDGRLESRKLHENLVLCDGTSFNASMLFANPPVQIGVCRYCRRPPYRFPWREAPTHGVLRLTRARTCSGHRCAVLCCSRHRMLCSDGRYRCLRCSRRWAWKEFVLGIFFERS